MLVTAHISPKILGKKFQLQAPILKTFRKVWVISSAKPFISSKTCIKETTKCLYRSYPTEEGISSPNDFPFSRKALHSRVFENWGFIKCLMSIKSAVQSVKYRVPRTPSGLEERPLLAIRCFAISGLLFLFWLYVLPIMLVGLDNKQNGKKSENF